MDYAITITLPQLGLLGETFLYISLQLCLPIIYAISKTHTHFSGIYLIYYSQLSLCSPAVEARQRLDNISASTLGFSYIYVAPAPVIIGHSKLQLWPHPNRHTRLIAFHSSSLDSFDFNLTVDLLQICSGNAEELDGIGSPQRVFKVLLRSNGAHSQFQAMSQVFQFSKYSKQKKLKRNCNFNYVNKKLTETRTEAATALQHSCISSLSFCMSFVAWAQLLCPRPWHRNSNLT